ncbi:hypothetical protein, partial [Cellulomonas algicola]|uniref:hypothetical protein n=1 Tax=Cellulomonas algicola TaxID=2071633 RepID=UPI001B356C2C
MDGFHDAADGDGLHGADRSVCDAELADHDDEAARGSAGAADAGRRSGDEAGGVAAAGSGRDGAGQPAGCWGHDDAAGAGAG